MKRLFILTGMAFFLAACTQADFLGVKKSDEYIAAPIRLPLDSSGIPGPPDSIQIITFADNGSGTAFNARSTTAPFGDISIDTSTQYGLTKYWLIDQIQDIDGAGAHFELGIQIITWYKKLPTQTCHTVQIISDSLENMLDASRDSSASAAVLSKNCLDSAQAQDGWVAKEATVADVPAIADTLELYDTRLDSLLAVASDGNVAKNKDTIPANLAKISGDLAAANNFETMLDGTGGGTLSLGGCEVRASGNDTALVIAASANGTGLGMYILGGGNGGEGVKIVGGNTKSALVAQAGSSVLGAHGFDLIGDGDGFGLNGSISTAAQQAIADRVWDEDTTGHTTAKSFAVMLKDTAAYQGSASGLTAAEAADSVWGHMLDTAWAAGSFGDSASGWGATSASNLDSGVVQRIGNRHLDSIQTASVTGLSPGAIDVIWDEAQSGHITAGTFGYYLDAPVSGVTSCTGAGTYPVSLVAYDSVSAQVVPGARISVYNSTLSALLALGVTRADGTTAVNLDSGSFVISAFAPGYVFSAGDTIEVAGAMTDSISGHRFDPGSPSAPDLCRVYGFIYGINGSPLEGVVVAAELTDGVVRHDSLIISPYKTSVATDSAGYFALDLIPSDGLVPAGTAYLISATYPGGTVLKKRLQVPPSANWLLSW